MDNDDSILVQEFQNGHDESFEQLIIKHRSKALSFALRYVKDMYIAEDIVQESFADIYVYKERYKNIYTFKTYLFTIVRNKSVDFIRKNNKVYVYEELEEGAISSPEEGYIKKESSMLIRQMVNELSDDYRTIIYLIEYYDFTYAEAAKIMGKNVGQIKILVYRARQKLKAMLERGV